MDLRGLFGHRIVNCYLILNINKKSDKSYELLMGPYNTINKLKNDYIVLNDSNFEDLDIIIND